MRGYLRSDAGPVPDWPELRLKLAEATERNPEEEHTTLGSIARPWAIMRGTTAPMVIFRPFD
jgi:hypothetical protein